MEKKVPMKVTLGDFVKDSLKVPIRKTQSGSDGRDKEQVQGD